MDLAATTTMSFQFPTTRRAPSPSTPSVSGSSLFSRRAQPDDADGLSLRTNITDDDDPMPRSGAPVRGKRKRLSKVGPRCTRRR